MAFPCPVELTQKIRCAHFSSRKFCSDRCIICLFGDQPIKISLRKPDNLFLSPWSCQQLTWYFPALESGILWKSFVVGGGCMCQNGMIHLNEFYVAGEKKLFSRLENHLIGTSTPNGIGASCWGGTQQRRRHTSFKEHPEGNMRKRVTPWPSSPLDLPQRWYPLN